MTSIIYKLISIALDIVIILIIFFLVKISKEDSRKKKFFVEYLESKKDLKNLIKFGFYNSNGFKEGRRVLFLEKKIYEEYQKNKDEVFLEYYVYIKKITLKFCGLYFFGFFLFCISMILISVE